jgi:hypothetical protein
MRPRKKAGKPGCCAYMPRTWPSKQPIKPCLIELPTTPHGWKSWRKRASLFPHYQPSSFSACSVGMRAYDAIRKIDFFPGETSIRAEAQWRDFTNAVEAIQSPGEPQPAVGRIARRDRMQYQGRLWATRRHLWVDRVASAWLIQRFIDPSARFVWLDTPADCPSDALGFDFDGATFRMWVSG